MNPLTTSFNSLTMCVCNAGIVEELLEVFPEFAQELDDAGDSPLHCACKKGRSYIVELLDFCRDVAEWYNYSGYMPLHLAVMNNHVPTLERFLHKAPSSFQLLTEKKRESVFH